jgi:hypothetical protein
MVLMAQAAPEVSHVRLALEGTPVGSALPGARFEGRRQVRYCWLHCESLVASSNVRFGSMTMTSGVTEVVRLSYNSILLAEYNPLPQSASGNVTLPAPEFIGHNLPYASA